jgi:hypothetical protein
MTRETGTMLCREALACWRGRAPVEISLGKEGGDLFY